MPFSSFIRRGVRGAGLDLADKKRVRMEADARSMQRDDRASRKIRIVGLIDHQAAEFEPKTNDSSGKSCGILGAGAVYRTSGRGTRRVERGPLSRKKRKTSKGEPFRCAAITKVAAKKMRLPKGGVL